MRDGALRPPTSWRSSGGRTPVHGTANSGTPAKGGAVFLTRRHVAPAARGRVDAEETRPEDDGRRSAAEEARTGESPLDVAAPEGGSPARLSKKSFELLQDPPETVRERRGRLMVAVDDATPTLGAASACRVLGLPRASLYRGLDRSRSRALVRRRRARWIRSSVRASWICSTRASSIRRRRRSTPPCSMRGPTSVRRARCIASSTPRTEVKERRDQVRRPAYAAPELLATRPNEVWSWDITKRLGPSKWTYFYLYVILDIFSRYVVGWMLAHTRARPWPSTSSARPARSTAFSRANSRSMRTAGRP